MTRATLVSMVLAFACNRSDPHAPTPATSSAAVPVQPHPPDRPATIRDDATTPTPTQAQTQTPPGASPTPSVAATATIIDVDAQAGPLDAQLVAVAARAKKEGRPLAVELWASWCPPCKTFDALIDSGEMNEALAGSMLVRVDVDMFDEELNELGFRAPQIPSLYRVDGRGRPVGKPLSGASWHKRGAAEIATALSAFLAAP